VIISNPVIRRSKQLIKKKSDQAKAQLAELFGDPVVEHTSVDENLSPAELAEKKLREMLGG
jgi:hypothetical protein